MTTSQPRAGIADFSRAVFGRAYRYDRRWDEALWRLAELRAVAELLAEREQLRAGPILDVGCGDGEVFGSLFGSRPDASGIDSCATYLDDVDRARTSLCYGDVRQEDAARMSFENGSFQLVFSNSVLEHIAPVEPIIREVFRVLRSRGTFLFTTPCPRLYSKDAYAWRRYLSILGLDGIGQLMVARECTVYRHVSIFEPTTWRRLLESAGFCDVEVRGYMNVEAARVMSLFSGITRVPLLARLAWATSREARALHADLPEDKWVERCREWLEPLLKHSGEPCGQLILARKP